MGRTLRAPSSLASRRRGHRLGRAGDDHLARGVVVGHPDLVLGPLAGRLGVVVGDARGGRPWCPGAPRRPPAMASPRATTRWTPSSKERAPLGHQGGVLTQAVAGAGGRGEPEPLDGVEHDQAHDEGGQLGVGRAGELLHGGVEQQAARSRPAMSDASAATSQEGWSTQARPIPERCDPCPGKVNTSTYRRLRAARASGRLRTPYPAGGGPSLAWALVAGVGLPGGHPARGRRRGLDGLRCGRCGPPSCSSPAAPTGRPPASARWRRRPGGRRAPIWWCCPGREVRLRPARGRPGLSAEPLDGPFVTALPGGRRRG